MPRTPGRELLCVPGIERECPPRSLPSPPCPVDVGFLCVRSLRAWDEFLPLQRGNRAWSQDPAFAPCPSEASAGIAPCPVDPRTGSLRVQVPLCLGGFPAPGKGSRSQARTAGLDRTRGKPGCSWFSLELLFPVLHEMSLRGPSS